MKGEIVDIKPIRSEEDYEAAVAEIDRLMDLDLDEDGEDRLEILSMLVEAYEDAHFPVGPPDPLESIKFRMEQAGKTQADLAELFGSRSRASEVLAGRRGLSLELIRRLNRDWGIPLESLVHEADRVAEKPARYRVTKRRPKAAARKESHSARKSSPRKRKTAVRGS